MIIFPGLIGSVAASGKGSVSPPSSSLLNLQVSKDGFTWEEGNPFALDATFPIYTFAGESKTYYIRAIGTTTEEINITSFSIEFTVSPSFMTLTGGDTASFTVTLNNTPFFESSETIRAQSATSGGDYADITISYGTDFPV
jgi:hypothetical protein